MDGVAKTSDTLPDDVAELQALVRRQAEQIETLQEQLRLALHKRFGRSSEKTSPDQLRLFNEAEVEAQSAAPAEDDETVSVPAHERRKRGRKPLPANLPRVRVEHDLAESEKACACGCQLTRIGEEVSEQLDYLPARLQVIQHVRFKYACRGCEGTAGDEPGVKIAALPPQPVPKSSASPGLLAHIVTAKYQDALPLYRQEKIFARLDIELPRATMAGWMIRAGELVVPLLNLMNETVLDYDILQMDETPVQVLKEAGRAAASRSYMWVRRGGPPDSPIILFDYAPSRGAEVPERLLQGYRGYLQSDDYQGYAGVGAWPGVTRVGCMGHARRKFDEAVKAQAKAKTGRGGLAREGLKHIARIYAVEREARDKKLGPEARLALRQEKARPHWEALEDWLEKSLKQVPPGTLTGKALAYLRHNWERLIRVLEDGRLEVDNNLCENVIRPFVLGRKNWLFADTARGAVASARLYSLIETAKANGLEPYAYLRKVFTELPGAQTTADIEALLPHAIEPAALTTSHAA